jgi:hypothetical protein
MKSLVVLASWALSGLGIFWALSGAILLPMIGRWWVLVPLAWIAAAIAHHRLALAWIDGRKLGTSVSLAAGMIGVLGLVAFPIALTFKDRVPEASELFTLIGIQLLLVLPAFLLSVYLNWFHAQPSEAAANTLDIE